jgi:hypothetical protein
MSDPTGKWFKTHQHQIIDDGFTENVIRRLPEKTPLLPFLIFIPCILAGFCLCLWRLDLEYIINLLHSVVGVNSLIADVLLQLKTVFKDISCFTTNGTWSILPTVFVIGCLSGAAGLLLARLCSDRHTGF